MIKTTTDKTTMVDTQIKWIDLNKSKPVIGTKVLLINRSRRVATTGIWQPGTEWTHWFPFPTFKDEP